MKKAQRGQSLVEFALIVPVFLVLMMGLFDGTRLLFQYNELQNAARIGARWAAVNVNRDSWLSFNDYGNQYSASGPWNVASESIIAASHNVTSTIVGQVNHSLTGIDTRQAWVGIYPENYVNPISIYRGTCLTETGSTVGGCTGMPITVTVSYTFTPILSFSMVHIPLQGRAVSFHE